MVFEIIDGSLYARHQNELICVQAWGENSLRVRATSNFTFSGCDGGLLSASATAEIATDGDTATVSNGRISATLTLSDGKMHLVFGRDGETVLSEYLNPCAPAVRIFARDMRPLGGGDYSIKARFEARRGEKIFGMGQYQQSDLDMKGCVLELAPKNAQVSIPFYVSNLGYGFLWNDPSIGRVSFGKNYTEWQSDRSSELDYWVTVGDTPKELIEAYTSVTGRFPDFPDDLLGLWQCKLRYRTQDEVLSVAREYHRRGLPLDLIVIDYYHWKHDGDWCFDPDFWPDPAAMVRELKSMGTRCMVSVWPTVQGNSVNMAEMSNRGLLVTPAFGEGGGIFGNPFYDATNPAAREFIWNECKKNYYGYGITAFWLDCAEPEFLPPHFEHYNYSVGPAEKKAGLYPLSHAKAFYDGMTAAGQKDAVNLTRSAWVGSQRYGAVVWSGDIRSTFETIRAQVCAGLNIGIAGIPWWTTDTAGFIGDVTDPDYNELLIRWFQFSTFSPVLRLHGYLGPYGQFPRLSENRNSGGYVHTAQPHELWSHGEEVYEILKKYIEIRIRLKDYLAALGREASKSGAPIMRAMFLEFPDDPNCWELQEQYMLGDRYLVAPVMYKGAREIEVYLPEGEWKCFHTGKKFLGGQTVTVPAPLDIIPVFERI